MLQDQKSLMMPHHVIMEDRKKLSVSGVQDVDSFDESTVVLYTNMGKMTVRGVNLHVNAFDVAGGDFSMEGDILGLDYSDEKKEKQSFLTRLFR